ncbi:MAG: flagellar biosynthesis anti-sigma factor FlgM [Hydrogenophaga sp.]|uniref:flagellar biosynthesis anti-sigma factor FlgM n=1 Tax=Hydrogenophaga sp. TaxID=1904254 RepID=UPI0016BCD1D2|nr:flagellar biosynthesis anti-sigma factor FlgM [Hydrogenophaga sp.]NIM41649.1 flagellar biosynthesis anti-sigma factor FlgM [Hydrogenophaga sp.]NIN26954.1 flagellar biosynthesis anti-sigma factor FlgM [Hydrogenophaga sp.]NIN31655.1 flagellar biosynthesis anti-sigma factor FlgM [Hydrogenophaga sp.]NIN55899.1 flagellar biosynthesis anti-sigma factor FlgM [Hydrogenophaga sp.]NIO52026.1 flagellar biosynthesis anti-sigma factor FlgM [Hydrogenophaga sp.]
MKVDSSTDSYIGSVAGGPAKAPVAQGEAVAKPASGAPQPGVTVTLSSAAAVGGASDSAVFNAEKVAAVKKSIEDGSFQVNPEAIADKLLANAAEMLNAGRG